MKKLLCCLIKEAWIRNYSSSVNCIRRGSDKQELIITQRFPVQNFRHWRNGCWSYSGCIFQSIPLQLFWCYAILL